jgi:hypothetical protein
MTNWFPPTLEDKLLVTYFVEKELTQDVGFARSVLNFIFKKPDGGLATARPLVNEEHLSMLIQSFGLDPRLLQRFGLSGRVQVKASETMTLPETGPAGGLRPNAKEFWAMKAELDAMKRSASWRMTAPLWFAAKCMPDLPPKKWTGLSRHTASESWADVAQGRMQAMGIVKALDILEEISAGLDASAVNPMVNPLGLEAVKEALDWRVVQTIAFAAHRGCYA